jgi:hypothetical protein
LHEICNTIKLQRRVQFQQTVAAEHRVMLQVTTKFDPYCQELTVMLDKFLKLMVTSLN